MINGNITSVKRRTERTARIETLKEYILMKEMVSPAVPRMRSGFAFEPPAQ
jgi:hypothetical protein